MGITIDYRELFDAGQSYSQWDSGYLDTKTGEIMGEKELGVVLPKKHVVKEGDRINAGATIEKALEAEPGRWVLIPLIVGQQEKYDWARKKIEELRGQDEAMADDLAYSLQMHRFGGFMRDAKRKYGLVEMNDEMGEDFKVEFRDWLDSLGIDYELGEFLDRPFEEYIYSSK